MIGKRITAHLLNRIIIFLPAMLLLGGVSLLINPNYFIFGKDQAGWLMFWLLKYMMALPIVLLDLLRLPMETLKILEIILPALISLITVEIISIRLLKSDIGMKIMGLKLVSTKDQPLSMVQIIVRTITKYFTLAFFPFAMIYIFMNQEKMTLHDRISSTKVVKA